MKQLFGFVMLIAVALLLLTVISGIGGVFGAISATWSSEQTSRISDVLADVLYFAGIVTVAVLGYGLFVNMSRGSKGWGGSRQSQPQYDGNYQIIDAQPQTQQPIGMIGMNQDNGQWYDFDEMQRDEMARR